MPIDVALLGCEHPHVADVLGVLASEPDLRLAAAWDAEAVPGAVATAAVSRADTAISRAHAVVICAPIDQRPALAVQAARAGRPILFEAPLALTAAEARRVAREIERSRTPALPAFFLRDLPALARLRAVLAERLLGSLAGASAVFTNPGVPRRAGPYGFEERAQHVVDALGDVELAAVALAGFGGVAAGTWQDVPLTLRAGWAAHPGGFELVVSGAAGSATLREGVLELGSAERWVGSPPDPGEAMRAFANAMRTRRFPRDALARAVEAQRVLDRRTVRSSG